MGETLTAASAPLVSIRGHLLRGQAALFTIQLIKNAKVLKEIKVQSPFDITYQDIEKNPEMTYYRIVIQGNGVRVFTNPVFVKREQP